MARIKSNGHPLFMGRHTYQAEKRGATGYGWTARQAKDDLSRKLSRR